MNRGELSGIVDENFVVIKTVPFLLYYESYQCWLATKRSKQNFIYSFDYKTEFLSLARDNVY